MNRFVIVLLALLLTACDRAEQPSGFAGLAGVAESEHEIQFLQPGPETGCPSPPPISALIPPSTALNGGISPRIWKPKTAAAGSAMDAVPAGLDPPEVR